MIKKRMSNKIKEKENETDEQIKEKKTIKDRPAIIFCAAVKAPPLRQKVLFDDFA